MRILVANALRGVSGGVEIYLRWLLKQLQEAGHEVALLYMHEAPQPELAIDRDVSIEHWKADERGLDGVRRWRPDLAYLQGMPNHAVEMQLVKEYATVLFAHAYYATCATGEKRHRFPQLRACTRPFGAACLALNYALGCGTTRPIRLLKQYADVRKSEPVLFGVRQLVVASHHMRQVFTRQGVPSDRINVVPLPTFERDALRTPPVPRPLANRVLFVGRLQQEKGCEVAILAADIASRILGRALRLDVAGTGSRAEACRLLASKARVDVHFHGWIDGETKTQMLRDADVLMVPSLWPEPFGIVGVEAGCHGVPSVAFATGGITDWLRPGVSGECPAPGDFRLSSLAEALVRALRSQEHWEDLRLGAWRMSKEFSPTRHLNELTQLFRNVTGMAS